MENVYSVQPKIGSFEASDLQLYREAFQMYFFQTLSKPYKVYFLALLTLYICAAPVH